MSAARDLDVVVFGASGFVGRLTAEHLARHAGADVRVGLAGRSAARLEAVRDELGARAADWPIVVADAADGPALAALAASTRVVAATVGPYRAHGLPLVEACARAGTHYADLSGEVLFVHDSIRRFHEVATASGARIVHACGFDAVPSDLGVLALHEAAGGDGLEAATLAVRALSGGASGGTLASGRAQLEELRGDPALRRIAADPYALSPDRAAEPDLGDERDLRGPVYDDALGQWLGPWVMAPFNTRIVRRSNALQGWAYGRGLRYREAVATGGGTLGRAAALALTGGLAVALGSLALPGAGLVADRLLPAPGQGPSAQVRARGHFALDVHARTTGGADLLCHIAAPGDPGYAATAVMLGQAVLCLARDGDRLPDRAGVLTPATAMGAVLTDRLRAAGQRYDVERR